MAWTKEQEAAITTRGNNILVSAGAGSGKTAVLTERITSLIKEGHSIKSLLVLTFTNAAAAEMKERVRDKLEKSDDQKCKEALKYIDTAKITTFDGYSLYLVKKYFYVLGISPDIKIANSYYLSLKCDEILDEILDKLYEENGFEIKSTPKRAGYIRNVRIRDSVFPRVLVHSVDYNNDGESAENSPEIYDISVINVKLTGEYVDTDKKKKECNAIEIKGFENPDAVRDIVFKKILIYNKASVTLQNCSNIVQDKITVGYNL